MANIKLENVNLQFKISPEKSLLASVASLYKKNVNPSYFVHAAKDISLELNDGDRLGIIGRNGAGKSTLLKIIAGIYKPNSGVVQVKGKTSCMFELSTGFEMNSNGWDNIKIRGLMLGMSPREIDQKAGEIAEFSELGDALNRPVKHYSSGMFIRLAFSISTAIEPEVLLLDEVMSAGDAGFISKAKKRIEGMIDKANILVFVSHATPAIKSLCNKVILLDKGTIVTSGNTEEVIEQYKQLL